MASHGLFPSVELFQLSHLKSNVSRHIGLSPTEYDVSTLDQSVLRRINEDIYETLTLIIPSEIFGRMEVELVSIEIFSSNFKVIESTNLSTYSYNKGKYYRGIIKGNPNSIVAISIFDNEVRGIFSDRRGNFVLGKQENQTRSEAYVFYNDKTISFDFHLDCGVQDDGVVYSYEELNFEVSSRSLHNCVEVYFEVDYDIYQNKGFRGTLNYVTALFNEVATIYAYEYIKMKIGIIFVWRESSPYTRGSSEEMLIQFQNYRNTGIDGDLGMLLSYKSSGGMAAGFSGLCNSYEGERLSFSSISGSFNGVPTYSWDVDVVTHELGHLLGSRHTHACVWNGNGTAIDGCAGSTEGSCTLPEIFIF